MGLATVASAPSVSAETGAPRTLTRPFAISRSSGDASSRSAAILNALFRTFRAATPTALPLVTSARLAQGPAPQLHRRVSPVLTVTSAGAQPSARAVLRAHGAA